MVVEAIAIGTGPSFYQWLRTPILPNKPKLFGCGRCTHFMNNLDYYFYGDSIHEENVPWSTRDNKLPTAPHHPNVIIYAHNRLWKPGFQKWPEGIPHGGNSGGAAISLACTMFNNIGLVGFDTIGLPKEFIDGMNQHVFNYWQSRGKAFYSMIPMNSVFNNRLIPYIEPNFHPL